MTTSRSSFLLVARVPRHVARGEPAGGELVEQRVELGDGDAGLDDRARDAGLAALDARSKLHLPVARQERNAPELGEVGDDCVVRGVAESGR